MKSSKAIVIDELKEYRLLLSSLISKKLGLEVIVAESCQEACSLIKSFKDEIKFIVSDIVQDANGSSLKDCVAAQQPGERAKLILFTAGYDGKADGLTIVFKTDLEGLLRALSAPNA